MAEYDVRNDVTPTQTRKPPSTPTISAMRTALNTFSATSYSTTRLNSMTELDMISACRAHGLSVVGLP